MRLVVDASVVVQLALTGEEPRRLAKRHDLVAPPILASEATSTLAQMAFRGDIPRDAARSAMVSAHALGVRLRRPKKLYETAWDLAASLGWAKTYDAEYVALARLDGIPILTIDERLRRGVGHLVAVVTPTDL